MIRVVYKVIIRAGVPHYLHPFPVAVNTPPRQRICLIGLPGKYCPIVIVSEVDLGAARGTGACKPPGNIKYLSRV